jgi:hypothetical protein
MGRSQSVVLSILISHQHLLHTRQLLPPSSSCISPGSGLADWRAFLSDAPASHHCQRNYETAGSLRSLGVTPVHRCCRPFRHLLAFLPFPGSAGYRSDLLQSISLWGEEGFSSCLTCPCHRAGLAAAEQLYRPRFLGWLGALQLLLAQTCNLEELRDIKFALRGPLRAGPSCGSPRLNLRAGALS